jgi:hypothetical protein
MGCPERSASEDRHATCRAQSQMTLAHASKINACTHTHTGCLSLSALPCLRYGNYFPSSSLPSHAMEARYTRAHRRQPAPPAETENTIRSSHPSPLEAAGQRSHTLATFPRSRFHRRSCIFFLSCFLSLSGSFRVIVLPLVHLFPTTRDP